MLITVSLLVVDGNRDIHSIWFKSHSDSEADEVRKNPQVQDSIVQLQMTSNLVVNYHEGFHVNPIE